MSCKRAATWITFILIAFTKATHAHSWKNCQAASADFTIDSVTLEPEHIVAGVNATFTISGVPSADIHQGKIEMHVKLAGIPVYFETDDLCSKAECPLKEGETATIVFIQQFPAITPPGPYIVELAGSGGPEEGSETPLFCVDVNFAVEPGKSLRVPLLDRIFKRKIVVQ